MKIFSLAVNENRMIALMAVATLAIWSMKLTIGLV